MKLKTFEIVLNHWYFSIEKLVPPPPEIGENLNLKIQNLRKLIFYFRELFLEVEWMRMKNLIFNLGLQDASWLWSLIWSIKTNEGVIAYPKSKKGGEAK